MRTFSSGATRDTADGKISYKGFLSPQALKAYGEYMLKNQVQADGTLRKADNWKLGIDKDAYVDSGWRHWVSVWTKYEAGEDYTEDLCAMFFNVQGLLHEHLKK